jgi:4-amino-4-deoxy-L-arabinose transferase-like glycosyltransferase
LDQPLVWGDSTTYWEIARHWMETGTYTFGEPAQRIFRAPGYPAVLIAGMTVAQWFGTTLSVFQARLIGCALGTLAVWLLAAWTADLSGNRRAGLIAGLLMALEPGAIAMSVFVLAEAAFIPVMILSLWAWTLAWRQDRLAGMIALGLLAGVVAGAAVLVRPSWLLFVPATALLAGLWFPRRGRQTVLALAVLLGMVGSLSPWWYRNYELTQRWVPTTLQVGASLYDGWNPQADGSSDMSHGYAATRPLLQQYRQRVELLMQARELDAVQQAAMELELASNDLLRQQAIQWGAENPGQLLRLFAIKVWRTWRPWPEAAEVNSLGTTVASVLSFLPLIALAAWGIGRFGCRDYAWALTVWPALYLTLLHGVFVGSLRYRQPAMIPLLVLAAVVMVDWFSRAGKSATDRR